MRQILFFSAFSVLCLISASLLRKLHVKILIKVLESRMKIQRFLNVRNVNELSKICSTKMS